MKTLAVIVNYKSAALTLKAAKSVLESQSLGPIRVMVVDNSGEVEEAERLRGKLPSPIVLRVNAGNRWFGSACNQAFEAFDSDVVLLINPDARLLPGCLERLQKTLLARRNAAAVSPQIFWDDELAYYLPPSYPTALFKFRPLLASWGSEAWINKFISLFWRRRSIKIWRSQKPLPLSNLSGGLVLLDRDAVQKAGGLFDPRFFLYFEDTDLFLRLKKIGFKLFMEPRARAIHYFDQCGSDRWREKRRLMEESQNLFLKKYQNGWSIGFKKILEKLHSPAACEKQWGSPDFHEPFSLNVPACLREQWLFEWSPNPDMTPAAARFGAGPEMRFPEKWWRLFSPGRYFGRLGGIDGLGRPFRQVSWVVHESI